MNFDPVFLLNGNLKNLSNLGIKKYYQKKCILKHLYRKGTLSNPEICKLTNLSSPSIHKLLNELIHENLVKDEGIGKSIGGRRPNLFGIDPEARFIIGISLGHQSSEVAVFNIKNQIINQIHTIDIHLHNSQAFIDKLYGFAMEIINRSGINMDKILAVGIGIPGLTDPASGSSYSHLNYSEKSVKELFEEKFDKPVFIDNDARVMALGEFAFGLAKRKSNVLCLNIGSGIGMGMILNGKLYQGNSGFAGEFGHIKIEEDGLLCMCGKRGCLETVASGLALERVAREDIGAGKITKIDELLMGDLSALSSEIIIKSAQRGDQYSIDLLAKIGEYLGKGLATLIHLFNPEAIIIGGKVASAENFITDSIQQTLNKYTIYQIKKETLIMTSQLGEMAGVLGAMALVMENVFEDVPASRMPV
nr:ROK family transcriptional regulator [Bacteroidota bacterium]